MTVKEFLEMYDGCLEIAVYICDIYTDIDGEYDAIEFLRSDWRDIHPLWLNANIECWSIRKTTKPEAAFKISLGVSKEV